MNKIIRTNERCYICDFGRAVEEDNIGIDAPAAALPSHYLDGMTNGSQKDNQEHYHKYQDDGHRYVFIDPRDGKPVCTHCSAEARATIEDLEYRDRDYAPRPWREEFEDALDSNATLTFEETTVEHVKNEAAISVIDHDDPIDWSNLSYWDNGNVRFPLTRKSNKFALTDEHRRQIDEIRRKKGYLKSPKEEEQERLERNKRLDSYWQPVPEKARLAKTSDWPRAQRAERDFVP